MKTLYEAQFAYVPKEYSGRVLVCVAKTQALTHLRQLEAAWRKVAPRSDVVHFEGTHTSMMRAPAGFAVAKQMARHIAEIESVAVVTLGVDDKSVIAIPCDFAAASSKPPFH